MSVLEIVAVIVTVIGVWLTTARSLWNYPFSLLSVALYAVFFYQIKLYADMGLQGIFAVSLLYGLWQWTHGRSAQGEVLVRRVSAREVGASLLGALALAAILGYLLSRHTDASYPWADSLLLAGSLVGSLWGARRHLENWWVWIVVDTLYVILYFAKHAFPTAALYAAFVAMAVIGERRWRGAWVAQDDRRAAPAAERASRFAEPRAAP